MIPPATLRYRSFQVCLLTWGLQFIRSGSCAADAGVRLLPSDQTYGYKVSNPGSSTFASRLKPVALLER